MTYITITEVRDASGAPSELISDTQIESFIEFVEYEMERWLNTKFTPTTRIDALDGNDTNRIFTTKNPLLSVREIITNDSTIDPENIHWEKSSGLIRLKQDADQGLFLNKDQDTHIKYLYGLLEESGTETTTTSASTAGTSVALTVSSETGFSVNDWIEIVGTDGNRETAKITATDTNEITVDQLVKTHKSGSTIYLLQTPTFIKRYMIIEAAIATAINAIGSTYTFNASYSLGDLNVTKGVPYTHWRESVQRLIEERKMRVGRIKPRPSILI